MRAVLGFFNCVYNPPLLLLAGDVELRDLQLKPEALNALKLPIKVKAGFVGTLKAKVRAVRGVGGKTDVFHNCSLSPRSILFGISG